MTSKRIAEKISHLQEMINENEINARSLKEAIKELKERRDDYISELIAQLTQEENNEC